MKQAHAVTLVAGAAGLAAIIATHQATAQTKQTPPPSGTTGRIAKFISTNTLGNSALTESSGRIGLGTPAPQALLQVNNTASYPRRRAAVTIVSRHFNADLGHTFTGLGFSDQGGTTNGYAGMWLLGDLLQFQTTKGGLSGAQDVFSTGVLSPSLAHMTINGAGNIGIASLPVGTVRLYATSPSTNATIYGVNTDQSDLGVRAGTGVRGHASNGVGVWGSVDHDAGLAGFFDGTVNIHGNASVSGIFSKGAGSFKIDHPLDPANKYLSHSFVESPDMMNVYNGNVSLDAEGRAVVELPSYFGTLNKEYRYQLTAIGAPGPNLHVAEEIADNRFTIAGGQPGQKVSWQVTGIRHDAFAVAHRIPVEEEKPAREKGLYLTPREFGQPDSKGIGFAMRSASRAAAAVQPSPDPSARRQAALPQ